MRNYIYRFCLIICIIFFKIKTKFNSFKLKIKGYKKVKNQLKFAHVYKFSNNGRYYMYFGGTTFKEGNKVIDNGQFALEIPGGKITLTLKQIGMIDFTEK